MPSSHFDQAGWLNSAHEFGCLVVLTSRAGFTRHCFSFEEFNSAEYRKRVPEAGLLATGQGSNQVFLCVWVTKGAIKGEKLLVGVFEDSAEVVEK